MGERSAHKGRPAEVSRPHAAEVSRPHAAEVSRPHAVEVSRPLLLTSCNRGQQTSSCRGQQTSFFRAKLVSSGQLVWVDYAWPPTLEGHISFVKTPILVFLGSMESPLSQEYIHMPEEDIKSQTKVLDRVFPGQVSSSVQVN